MPPLFLEPSLSGALDPSLSLSSLHACCCVGDFFTRGVPWPRPSEAGTVRADPSAWEDFFCLCVLCLLLFVPPLFLEPSLLGALDPSLTCLLLSHGSGAAACVGDFFTRGVPWPRPPEARGQFGPIPRLGRTFAAFEFFAFSSLCPLSSWSPLSWEPCTLNSLTCLYILWSHGCMQRKARELSGCSGCPPSSVQGEFFDPPPKDTPHLFAHRIVEALSAPACALQKRIVHKTLTLSLWQGGLCTLSVSLLIWVNPPQPEVAVSACWRIQRVLGRSGVCQKPSRDSPQLHEVFMYIYIYTQSTLFIFQNLYVYICVEGQDGNWDSFAMGYYMCCFGGFLVNPFFLGLNVLQVFLFLRFFFFGGGEGVGGGHELYTHIQKEIIINLAFEI